MNKQHHRSTILAVIVFLSTSFTIWQSSLLFSANSTTKEQAVSQLLSQSLQGLHYSQAKFDDEYSKRAFKLFIDRLDFQKRFFIQSDIDQLSKLDTYIDDEFTNSSFRFFELATKIYSQRVDEVKRFYKPFLDQKLDVTFPEVIETDGEKLQWAKSRTELENRWKKIIRFELIQEYLSQIKAEEAKTSNNITLNPLPIKPALLKKAKEKVAKTMDNMFDRISKVTTDDEYYVYFNSLANSYDPHTSFFAPQNKEDFDISMTGQLEGIGALLREEDDQIKIVRVIPGSPAWRQKELEADDIILAVAEPGEEPVSLINVRVQDAVKYIRGKKGTPVNLTVKKLNGEVKTIQIIRDVVILEDTFAKSALIKDPQSNRTFGYIQLPSFYRDFKDSAARNSTDDVEKLVYELQTHDISGLILDLRNNGGGALEDAVKMSGLFIQSGPIVQVRNQVNAVSVLQDKDPKIAYKGPLIVLINENSASASEILSAALQDYHRALIVGTDHSFGKGTVQTFIDLDQHLSPFYAKLKPLGSAKITIQKFYRINGDSTQYKGVHPDIVLNNADATIERGEESLDYSLPWDAIQPLDYTLYMATMNVQLLRDNSQTRIAENPAFLKQKKSLERQQRIKDHTERSLDLTAAYTFQTQNDKELDALKDIAVPTSNLVVTFAEKDPKLLKENEEKLKDWHSQIKKDYMVEETIAILNDMINNEPPKGLTQKSRR